MDDLVERPPVRFANRGERTIGGISDAEQEGHQVVVGDTQVGARLLLIPHRGVPVPIPRSVAAIIIAIVA